MHTDLAGSSNKAEKRRVAYIMHLSRRWAPEYGGDLVWMSPTYSIHAGWNSLTLFSVSKASFHFVSPVAEHAPTSFPWGRIAASGWWTSTDVHEAERVEAESDQGKAMHENLVHIDGRTGQPLDAAKVFADQGHPSAWA